MKLAVMQPYFLPYIGYFQLIYSVDKFILYDLVSFRKKSWITRNYILPANNEMVLISVPVTAKSSNKLISDVNVNNEMPWQNKLLKMLQVGYKRAEFFDETFNLLEKICRESFDSLHLLNSHAVIEICRHLNIPTEISFQNEEYKDLEEQLIFHPEIQNNEKVTDRKTERILRICKNEKADTYYNPPGGQELYNKDIFSQNDVTLSFIVPEATEYKQFGKSFFPNLSVVDVLMHCGAKKTSEMLKNYKLA